MIGGTDTVTRCSAPLDRPGPRPAFHRTSLLELAPLPGAIPCARLHTVHVLHEWGLRHRTIPEWFQPWADIEARATTLRWYEPLLVPGLLQTEDYARAILAVEPGAEADKLDDRVGGRISRQAILARANAPQLWSVVDEGVLHRRIGGPKVMHDQLEHLADLAENPQTTIQVIPASAGAHAGLLGAFNIADLDGSPSMVYLENAAEAQIADSPTIVARAMLRFDALRSEALPRAASRELIMKIAVEKWT